MPASYHTRPRQEPPCRSARAPLPATTLRPAPEATALAVSGDRTGRYRHALNTGTILIDYRNDFTHLLCRYGHAHIRGVRTSRTAVRAFADTNAAFRPTRAGRRRRHGNSHRASCAGRRAWLPTRGSWLPVPVIGDRLPTAPGLPSCPCADIPTSPAHCAIGPWPLP